ncbi:MAG: transcriptional regulator, AsnC family [Caulobacter sp.]|nr:transcriptional regulator, AsnC family [Caulobacter sp.]
MNQERSLDGYDRKILRTLSADGRVSWRDLADAIGLTLTPTLRRVRRLEADGYIRGYAAQLDEEKLAGGMTVFVSVTLERQVEDVLAGFEQIVAAMPEIVGGFLMTGGADYLLHTVVRSLEHYQDLLTRLTRAPGVAHIESSFALKAFVRRSSLEAGALS